MLPLLVLVAGPPGSGKTTLAGLSGGQLALPVISHNEITSGLARTAGGQQPRGFEVSRLTTGRSRR